MECTQKANITHTGPVGLRSAHVEALIAEPGIWFPASDVQQMYNDSIGRGDDNHAWHIRYEDYVSKFLPRRDLRDPFDAKSAQDTV